MPNRRVHVPPFVCNLPGFVLRDARLSAGRVGCVEGHQWYLSYADHHMNIASLSLPVSNCPTFALGGSINDDIDTNHANFGGGGGDSDGDGNGDGDGDADPKKTQ